MSSPTYSDCGNSAVEAGTNVIPWQNITISFSASGTKTTAAGTENLTCVIPSYTFTRKKLQNFNPLTDFATNFAISRVGCCGCYTFYGAQFTQNPGSIIYNCTPTIGSPCTATSTGQLVQNLYGTGEFDCVTKGLNVFLSLSGPGTSFCGTCSHELEISLGENIFIPFAGITYSSTTTVNNVANTINLTVS